MAIEQPTLSGHLLIIKYKILGRTGRTGRMARTAIGRWAR